MSARNWPRELPLGPADLPTATIEWMIADYRQHLERMVDTASRNVFVNVLDSLERELQRRVTSNTVTARARASAS